ncbi:hypothetical protein cypCar_00046670 [Cyprinus carpio]|nr:hypothetical protein cypCar_00046670 [Cyprinus carpio]
MRQIFFGLSPDLKKGHFALWKNVSCL